MTFDDESSFEMGMRLKFDGDFVVEDPGRQCVIYFMILERLGSWLGNRIRIVRELHLEMVCAHPYGW